MSQKSTQSRFTWDAAKRIAAFRVADGRLTDEAIATEAGVDRRTVVRWRKHPEFDAFVAAILADVEVALSHLAIASKKHRLAILQDMHDRLVQIVRERAENPHRASAGISSGLLVKQWKKIGHGDDAEIVEEYAVDTGLVTAIQNVMKRAAEELGQTTTTVKVTHSGSVTHHHRDLSNLSDDELQQLRILADKIEAGQVTG